MRVIKAIQVFVFAVVLVLPLLFFNHDPERIIYIENKRVTSLPSLTLEDGSANEAFPTEFETYLDDNIGLREQAIALKVASFYALFNRIEIPTYVQGEQGHIYFSMGEWGINNYQGIDPVPQDELEACLANLQKADEYVQSTGAKLVVVTIPDKEGVYPEYYNRYVIQHRNDSRIDQIVSYVQQNSNIDITSLKPVLLENKNPNTLLYYKTYDPSHWNMAGAFVGYGEIIRQCQKYAPDMMLLRKEDVVETVQPAPKTILSLDRSPLVTAAMNFNDTIYEYTPNDGFSAQLTGKIPPYAEGEKYAELDIAHYAYYHNPQAKDAPRILMIGDSYAHSFFVPLLAESCSELFYTASHNEYDLKQAMDDFQPDIVLHEVVDRAAANFEFLAALANVAAEGAA